jgi:hypothetical protein
MIPYTAAKSRLEQYIYTLQASDVPGTIGSATIMDM